MQHLTIINIILGICLIPPLFYSYINYKAMSSSVVYATAVFSMTYSIGMQIAHNSTIHSLAFMPFIMLVAPIFTWHIDEFGTMLPKRYSRILDFLPSMINFSFAITLMVMGTPLNSYLFKLVILIDGIYLLVFAVWNLLGSARSVSSRLRGRDVAFLCMFAVMGIFFILITFYTPAANKQSGALFFTNVVLYSIGALMGFIYAGVIIKISLNPDGEIFQLAMKKKQQKKYLEGESKSPKQQIADDELMACEHELTKLMENQIYLQKKITLSELSKMIKTSSLVVSQTLNVKMGVNFYTYVNNHRVAHAIALMRTGNTFENFDILSDESGFNNRVSFNQAFKKVTGLTPIQYAQQLKNS